MNLRVEHIFNEEMKGDTSFREQESGLGRLFGSKTYTKTDMRETWDRGIKHGIEIGLRKASLKGQRIELDSNTKEESQREFLEKFYELADQYKCSIQYHPEHGMVVVARQTY